MAIDIYFDNEIINDTHSNLTQYYHSARSYSYYDDKELEKIYSIVKSILKDKYNIKIETDNNNFFKIIN